MTSQEYCKKKGYKHILGFKKIALKKSNLKCANIPISFTTTFIYFAASLFKIVTANRNSQQIISYNFSHIHHKIDVYCRVMQNKNLSD